ncbi:MAG: tRNA(His) guanylyltransferase Thg1 family protein [Bryobacter sp.]|nr:tRNA(His) guanylyltransferase Thg1 family protein [Bryobacter sp.]
MKDELGRRIKEFYEDALRVYLPRQTYFVVRVDGRAFHTFTRHLERPYSRRLAAALDAAALVLAREMIGCRFAYGQSDEYSFLGTDLGSHAPLWFDGNVQKIASVSASVFTAAFNQAFPASSPTSSPATFDARVLCIPQASEVEKYFLWRQLDASANSLNMLASAHYSHQELLGKTEAEKHDLLHAIGLNWAKEPIDFKRGRLLRRDENGAWMVDEAPPIFQREPAFLASLLSASPT